MIANDKSKALALHKSQFEQVDPDETYISISSIFKRSIHGQSIMGSEDESTEIQGDDLIGRSKALSAADRLSEFSSTHNNSTNI